MEVFRQRIAEHSRERPLLITIDDVHLADELTALALRSLIPELASSRVVWVLSRRRTAAGGLAQDVLDELLTNGAQRYELGPLGEEAVGEICSAALAADPGPDLLSFALRSQGDPALLIDLLTSLRDSDIVDIVDGTVRLRSNQLPPDLLSSVETRLRGLSPTTRQLLDAGSVVGRPFTVHEVADLIGIPPTGLMAAVYQALESGVLVESGSALTFRHSLVRDAVHHRMPGPVRATLHREAIPLQLADHRDAAEIAKHVLAGEWSGEKLVSQLTGLLENAGNGPQLRTDMVRTLIDGCRLGEARLVIGHPAGTEHEQHVRSGLLLELAELVTFLGLDIGIQALTQRLLAENRLSERTRSQLLAASAHGLLHNRRLAEADRVAAEAITLGERVADSTAHTLGLLCRSVVAWQWGDLADATELAQQATDILGSDSASRHVPQLWLAKTLIAVDRFDEAEAVLEASRQTGEHQPPAWSQSAWHATRALLRLVTGHVDEAAADATAAVSAAAQPNPLHARPLTLLGYVSILRNDMAAAQRYLWRAQQVAVDGSGDARELAWRRALLQDAEGRAEVALGTFEEVCHRALSEPFYLPEEPQAAATMVRIVQLADMPHKAEVVVEAIQAMSRRNPNVPSVTGAAKHAEGLHRGNIAMLHAAAADYSSCGRSISAAAALEDAGYAEDAASHRSRAVSLLRKAHEHYVQAGAERDSTRVRTALGRSAPARSPRRMHTTDDWYSLTESEMRVAALVAEGLSNREVAKRLFLSPHTVDSHLRKSFAKLGVSNRVQLTRTVMPILTAHPEKT